MGRESAAAKSAQMPGSHAAHRKDEAHGLGNCCGKVRTDARQPCCTIQWSIKNGFQPDQTAADGAENVPRIC